MIGLKNTRSRNVLVGPRLARRSRMIERAPLRWLFKTVEDPLLTTCSGVSLSQCRECRVACLVIQQENDDGQDLVSIALVFVGY